MPSTNKTPYLGLSQWVTTDVPKMEDFNRDNQVLDTVAQPLHIAGNFSTLQELQTAYPSGDGTNSYIADGTIYVWTDDAWRSVGIDLSGYYNKTETNDLLSEKAAGDENGNAENANQLDGKSSNYYVQSNPNLLINGDFQIWQKGTDITIASGYQYACDRWCFQFINTKVTRLTNTSESPCLYSCRATNASGSAQNVLFFQALENYQKLNGKTLTVSGWIRGVGGFSGDYYVRIGANTASNLNLTLEWQYFTVTMEDVLFNDVNVRDRGVIFYGTSQNSPSADQGIEIAGIKLELGDHATPFVPRLYAEELALCQRYCIDLLNKSVDSSAQAYLAILNAQSTTIAYGIVPITISMRTRPTTSFAGTIFLWDGINSIPVTAISVYGVSSNSLQIRATADSGLTVGSTYILYAEAPKSNQTLLIDAEIY